MSRRLLVVFLLALAAWPAAGCSTNAATGRSQLVFMSRDREIAMGEESMPALTEAYGGAYPSGEAQAYVTDIGERLASYTEADNPTLPWEFTLLDSEVVNAFALPGGKVFVSRGLVSRLDDEAELACVLGHEIGHVTAKHVDERISRQLLVTGAAVAAGVAAQESDKEWVKKAVPVVVGVGATGYILSFGRQQELEADRLGMRYAARAGYDPRALVAVLEVLRDEANSSGGRGLEIFSTHPDPDRRITLAQEELAEHYAGVTGQRNAEQFQRVFRDLLTAAGSKQAWCALCAAQPEARAAVSAE